MRKLIERNLESGKPSLWKLLKPLRYSCLSMAAILLSMRFPAVEVQLLVLSVIAGAKWIMDSNSRSIRIVLEERW